MLYLHNILNGIWMMDEAYATNYIPMIAGYLKGERQHSKTDLPAMNDRNSFQVASNSGSRFSADNAPKGSIAILNISGAITKQDQECGPAGMKTKSDLLKQCYASDNISAVILTIDSGGGQAVAMRLLSETISQKNKPVGAFIEDNACSAAYGIASGCDYICANSDFAVVGSIGTYITIADYTEKMKQMGINLIEIYATASTDKNKDFKDAIAGNPDALRAQADTYNEMFLSMIEKNRGDKLTADRSVWGTGQIYFGKKAVELGLIDGIDTFENFINYFNS